jgi:hypothetical protein
VCASPGAVESAGDRGHRALGQVDAAVTTARLSGHLSLVLRFTVHQALNHVLPRPCFIDPIAVALVMPSAPLSPLSRARHIKHRRGVAMRYHALGADRARTHRLEARTTSPGDLARLCRVVLHSLPLSRCAARAFFAMRCADAIRRRAWPNSSYRRSPSVIAMSASSQAN